MLDVVLAPSRALEPGTDVPGRVALVQGGSAANTARWLGRLGARTSLIAAVGRDSAGRALVDAVRSDRVTPRVSRVAGARTGRIGVLVEPGGERSFVATAAQRTCRQPTARGWFAGAEASTPGPLPGAAQAAVGAVRCTRREGGRERRPGVGRAVVVGWPSRGPRSSRVAPDFLLATAAKPGFGAGP
jgi:sugar/nucleoside kinase (ribokinase family)